METRLPLRPASVLAPLPWIAVLAVAGVLAGGTAEAQSPVFSPLPGGPMAAPYPNPYPYAPPAGPYGPGGVSFAPVYYDQLSQPGAQQGPPALPPPSPFAFLNWTVDYRLRRFNGSRTSYEFGTPDPSGPSPLSRLDFPISSGWHGLEVAIEEPRWEVRGEWMTNLNDQIYGQFEDRDWRVMLDNQWIVSDLGLSQARWIDGQSADVSLQFRLLENLFGYPVSLWPVGGFRWQKFDIMAFDAQQYFYDFIFYDEFFLWYTTEGDIIRFRQEYYQYYVGGQLRTVLHLGDVLPGIRLTFQGDWADVQAFNYDHHLLREGIRITKDNTDGDSWHVGGTVEILLSDHFTLGMRADYMEIRTAGTQRLINGPLGIDESWTRGVRVWSDQTTLTMFFRLRF